MAKRKVAGEVIPEVETAQQKAAKTRAANKEIREAKAAAKLQAQAEELEAKKIEKEVETEKEVEKEVEAEKEVETGDSSSTINVIVPSEDSNDESEDEDEDIPTFPLDGNSKTLNTLKLNSDLESVYVGRYGGLFDVKTFKSSTDKRAILYKNPYFKK